jgi:hypothetical protein
MDGCIVCIVAIRDFFLEPNIGSPFFLIEKIEKQANVCLAMESSAHTERKCSSAQIGGCCTLVYSKHHA